MAACATASERSPARKSASISAARSSPRSDRNVRSTSESPINGSRAASVVAEAAVCKSPNRLRKLSGNPDTSAVGSMLANSEPRSGDVPIVPLPVNGSIVTFRCSASAVWPAGYAMGRSAVACPVTVELTVETRICDASHLPPAIVGNENATPASPPWPSSKCKLPPATSRFKGPTMASKLTPFWAKCSPTAAVESSWT
ncbi:hypothetical protein Mal15_01520 [Stieleria maiorica]|uniref:Uncharacterized protein n=1 Tax=Stieleria maiorica TaxID=2795974 RepID=A0A5B9M7K8_9BACT|nr:hypothetical protein Mal15_01520 [Stieleria maiorica]